MFVTIVDFLVFSIFVALVVTAYILIRAALRERLIKMLVLHSAYTLTERNELQYNGMTIVEEDDHARSPRPSDFDEAEIADIVNANHHAGNVLSWGWPVTWPLTKYRIKKTLELSQLSIDMRNQWEADRAAETTEQTEQSTELVALDTDSREDAQIVPVEAADITVEDPVVPDDIVDAAGTAHHDTEQVEALEPPAPISELPNVVESTDEQPEESHHVSIDQNDYLPGTHHLGSPENVETIHETPSEVDATKPLPVVDLSATQVIDLTGVIMVPETVMTTPIPVQSSPKHEPHTEKTDESDQVDTPETPADSDDSFATDAVAIDRDEMNAALEQEQREAQQQIADRAAAIEAELAQQRAAERLQREQAEQDRLQQEREDAERAAKAQERETQRERDEAARRAAEQARAQEQQEREEAERQEQQREEAERAAQQQHAARQAIEDRRILMEAALEKSRNQGFLK